MSLTEAQRFYQKLQQDVEFFKSLDAQLQASAQEQLAHNLQQFAVQHGYDFSATEYQTLLSNPTTIEPTLDLQKAQVAPNNSSAMPHAEPQLSVNQLERFFIWLSGASPKILATCPESEQKKHAALGGAVLIPAALALITVSFFLYTLNFNRYAIVPVALLWSSMILLMDRALLATYRQGLSKWGKAGQFSLRLCIAFLIAVTVAHPVVLLLFNERIDAAYNEGRIKTERAALALQCDLNNPQSNVRLLDNQITQLRGQLQSSDQVLEPPACKAQASGANPISLPILTKLSQDLDALKAKQLQADQDVLLFTENAEKEKQGIASNGLTGIRGCKKDSQCRKWLRQASVRKDDSLKLGKDIVNLEIQINKFNEQIATQLLTENQTLSNQCTEEREALKNTRTQQHSLDQQRLATLNAERAQLNARCVTQERQITALKPDILTQTELLTQLMFPQHQVSWHNLLVFLVFMLLFLAIDMLAVVLKMSRLGVYETKVEIVETHSKLLEFIQKRHHLIMQFTHIAQQEQVAIAQLNIDPLQQGLDKNFNTLVREYTQADQRKLETFFKP